MSGQQLDLDGFLRVVDQTSAGQFARAEAQSVFKSVAKMGRLTFELFERTFKCEVPNSLEMETKVIR
jgi:hypothetical protein